MGPFQPAHRRRRSGSPRFWDRVIPPAIGSISGLPKVFAAASGIRTRRDRIPEKTNASHLGALQAEARIRRPGRQHHQELVSAGPRRSAHTGPPGVHTALQGRSLVQAAVERGAAAFYGIPGRDPLYRGAVYGRQRLRRFRRKRQMRQSDHHPDGRNAEFEI